MLVVGVLLPESHYEPHPAYCLNLTGDTFTLVSKDGVAS